MTDQIPTGETSPPDGEELSFEEALERLEMIVEELEEGRMTLEESLARFEEGMRLRAVCLRRLQQAETRIEQVLSEAEAEPEASNLGLEEDE
ncbi:MAG: exodeoxyribonuclease VII small subunit [Candidatus Zipacnadales bacterium]